MSEQDLKFVNVEDIRINKESLRTVDQKNPDFIELAESVKKEGVLNAINVSPDIDPDTKKPFYTLVDGLQRLTAAKAAGLETIPAIIMTSTDLERLKRQIITNAIRVQASPAEYSKQLLRILEADPIMTKASLAASLGKSEGWLVNMLHLTKLAPEIASLVDEGTINVTSATWLAKLPPEVQLEYKQQAIELPHTEFMPLVVARKKAIDTARREGRAATADVFEPVARLQKIPDIKTEIESGVNGNNIIGQSGLRTAQEGFKAALEWVLHLDPFSVAEAKAKHEEMQKTKKEQSEAANKEREKKKLASAELKAKRSKLALETMEAGGDVDAVLKQFDVENGLDK